MDNPRNKLLIIFDIDETLIHFNKNYKENGQPKVLFRPNVCSMLKMLNNDPFFYVGLWTYSDGEYALDIANLLIKECKLRKDFFKCILYDDYIEADEDGIVKNLSVFHDVDAFNELKQRVTTLEEENEKPVLYFNENTDWMYHFSKFNTLLVDDRFNNLSNSSNIENGLLIEPFHDNKSDNICKLLIDIFKKCKKDIMDSSPEDLNVPLLNFNRVKRMKLEKYYKKYKINFDFVYGPKNRKPYKPLNDRSAERLQQNDLLSSDKSEIVYISIGETHQGETNEGFTLIDPNPLNLGARRGRTAASATAAASASTRKNKKLDCPKTCPPGYKCGCIPESDGGRGRGRGGTSRRRRHKRTLKNKK